MQVWGINFWTSLYLIKSNFDWINEKYFKSYAFCLCSSVISHLFRGNCAKCACINSNIMICCSGLIAHNRCRGFPTAPGNCHLVLPVVVGNSNHIHSRQDVDKIVINRRAVFVHRKITCTSESSHLLKVYIFTDTPKRVERRICKWPTKLISQKPTITLPPRFSCLSHPVEAMCFIRHGVCSVLWQ